MIVCIRGFTIHPRGQNTVPYLVYLKSCNKPLLWTNLMLFQIIKMLDHLLIAKHQIFATSHFFV